MDLGCDLLRLLQGSFGPFGPKVQKKSENGFPGPLGPGGRKSRKRVEKESKKSKNSQFWTLFRLFFDFFDPRGREPIFRTFFGLWARRAQMTPVAGEEDRKTLEMLHFVRSPETNHERLNKKIPIFPSPNFPVDSFFCSRRVGCPCILSVLKHPLPAKLIRVITIVESVISEKFWPDLMLRPLNNGPSWSGRHRP